MSTKTAPSIPAHPVSAGATPALLWAAAQLLGLATQAAAVLLGFWFTHHLAQGTLPEAAALPAILGLYAAVFAVRWLVRTARFHTPGGLVRPAHSSLRQRILTASPGWARSALGYVLIIFLIHWLVHTPLAGEPVTGIPSTWSTAQAFMLGLIPVFASVLVLETARAVRRSIRTRSGMPLIDPALTAGFVLALTGVAMGVSTPYILRLTVIYAATLAAMTLVMWAVVAFTVGRFPRADAAPIDVAGIVLTWWHGAPTLDDRRRYTPIIKALLITVATIFVVVMAALELAVVTH